MSVSKGRSIVYVRKFNRVLTDRERDTHLHISQTMTFSLTLQASMHHLLKLYIVNMEQMEGTCKSIASYSDVTISFETTR